MVLPTFPSQDSYGLSDYGRLLKRRWAWVVAGVVAGLVAGWVVQERTVPTYTSEASVIVEPSGISSVEIVGGRTSGAINLDTEAQLVRSAEVAERARQELGSELSTEELVENVLVTVPPNSQILTIAYQAATPAGAQAGAAAFAEAYLANRAGVAQDDLDVAVENLREQRDALAEQLATVSQELGAMADDDPARAYSESQQGLLTSQVSNLDQQIQSLSSAGTRPGRVISPAVLPTDPTGPISRIYLLSGALAGLLLGLGLALIRERTDPRIHGISDVERFVGLPVLATVPAAPEGARVTPIAVHNAYDRLRNAVISAERSGHRMLLLSGVDRTTPTASVAAILAKSLSASGRKVIVVQAVPDVPETTTGLSDLLTGEPLPAAVTDDEARLVDLGAGTAPGSLRELLAGQSAADVFDELQRNADVVLVVAPAADEASTQTLAGLVPSVIHLARDDRSRRDALADAAEAGTDAEATSLGVVLVTRRGPVGWARPSAPLPPAPDDDAPEERQPAEQPPSVEGPRLTKEPASEDADTTVFRRIQEDADEASTAPRAADGSLSAVRRRG